MATETDTSFQPPYMAWTTFDSIVDQFRAVGLPAQIDRSVLRSRSGGDQSQFLRTASGFGFIDGDGAPTERFREYVADPERRPQIMAEMLRETYPTVLALPEDATPQMLTEQFREMNVEGDTARKAIAFYLNAARFAKLPLSPHFKSTRPGAGGRKTASRRSAPTRRPTGAEDGTADVARQSSPDPLASLHPAIVTLVKSLPDAQLGVKSPFPSAEREEWFDYARAAFNLIYSLPEDNGEPA